MPANCAAVDYPEPGSAATTILVGKPDRYRILRSGYAVISRTNDGRKMAGPLSLRSRRVHGPASVLSAERIGGQKSLPTTFERNQRNQAEINAVTTQKITMASGGTRQRSSSRKPVKAIATSRPLPMALSQIGL